MNILSLSLLLLISSAKSQNSNDIKLSLIDFLLNLSSNNHNVERKLNWNANSDPCIDGWQGISCNKLSRSLRSINLESLNLTGSINGKLLSNICNSSSLSVLNLNSNSLTGALPHEISNCLQLTKLFVSDNRLSGKLPFSLPNLGNLKKLEISNNNFSGNLPWNLSDISGLDTFLAENNSFSGTIPAFDLKYFNKFNVSFNQLSGPLPLNSAKFALSSFDGNSGLCGKPLEVSCSLPSSFTSEPKRKFVNDVVFFLGYFLLVLALVLLLLFYLLMKKKDRVISEKRETDVSTSRSENSFSSPQSAAAESLGALIVLSKDERRKDMKFEDLLRAPAELIKNGVFGSLYNVVIGGGEPELVVKRIKDSTLTGEEFRKRIMRICQGSHPNVLPVTALYCSNKEKIVVYEYQRNGSLFRLLHENGEHAAPKWATRLHVAARVSAGLSYMHQTLLTSDTFAAGHGNLKASNILFSSAMEPVISEYGLTALPRSYSQLFSTAAADEPFSTAGDVFAVGVIFMELLTGKRSEGFDLAQWVLSVVREEWTTEVFDRSLLEGGEDAKAEKAMVRLLQVALRCISVESLRPTMTEVAAVVEAIRKKSVAF